MFALNRFVYQYLNVLLIGRKTKRFVSLQIDILYKRVPLPDHYTLIDVAYIYSWKRVSFYFPTSKYRISQIEYFRFRTNP